MDIHDFIFLLIKNIAYFIFLIIVSALIAGIAKIISIPLMVAAVILIFFQYFAFIWMGYLNTKDSKDHKLKIAQFQEVFGKLFNNLTNNDAKQIYQTLKMRGKRNRKANQRY